MSQFGSGELTKGQIIVTQNASIPCNTGTLYFFEVHRGVNAMSIMSFAGPLSSSSRASASGAIGRVSAQYRRHIIGYKQLPG